MNLMYCILGIQQRCILQIHPSMNMYLEKQFIRRLYNTCIYIPQCPDVTACDIWIHVHGNPEIFLIHDFFLRLNTMPFTTSEVITADGQLLTVSSTENSNLYWALSGGGSGTCGVVVSLTVKMHLQEAAVAAGISFQSQLLPRAPRTFGQRSQHLFIPYLAW